MEFIIINDRDNFKFQGKSKNRLKEISNEWAKMDIKHSYLVLKSSFIQQHIVTPKTPYSGRVFIKSK